MLEMIMAYARAYAANITKREEGQAMVEYALILALVSVAAVVTLGLVGTGIDNTLQTVVGKL